MSVLSRRRTGYKAGVYLLMFASGIFFVGFVSPHWKTLYSADTDMGLQLFDEGLWMYCVSEEYEDAVTSTCVYARYTKMDAWFQVVRSLEGFAFVGLILSILYTVKINCCRDVGAPLKRHLEIMASVSGLMGFTGCMVYLAYLSSGVHGHMVLYQETHHVISTGHYKTRFYWAFYMASVSSALSLLASILLFIFNQEVPLTSLPVPHAGCRPKGEGQAAIIAVTSVSPTQGQDREGKQTGYEYSYGYGYPASFEPLSTSY